MNTINESVAGEFVALVDAAWTTDPRHLLYRKHDVIRVIGEDVETGRYIGRLQAQNGDDDGDSSTTTLREGLVSPRRVVKRNLDVEFAALTLENSRLASRRRSSAAVAADAAAAVTSVSATSKSNRRGRGLSIKCRSSTINVESEGDPRMLLHGVNATVQILQMDHPSGYWVGQNEFHEVGLVRPRSVVEKDLDTLYVAVSLGDSEPAMRRRRSQDQNEENPMGVAALPVFKGDKIDVLLENHASGFFVARRQKAPERLGLVDPEWIAKVGVRAKFICTSLSSFDNVSDPRILHMLKGDRVGILSETHPSKWWVGGLLVGGESGCDVSCVGLVNPRKVARCDHPAPLYECVALCASNPNAEEDLKFEKGDKIEILDEKHPSPKWLGRRKKKGGEIHETESVEVGLIPPQSIVRCDNPVNWICVANLSHEGVEELDLSFFEGDRIEIVQEHYLHQKHWRVGRRIRDGQYGVFDKEMVSLVET